LSAAWPISKPHPGTVWKIEVKVGDQVDEGDTVLISSR